jgi:hypothetical protein
LLLFSTTAIAQEQTPPGDFTVGSPIKNKLIDYPDLLVPFEEAGFNTIWQRADSYTQELLGDYKLIALNEYNNAEYIFHYTTAYYSKWEAEQNQFEPARVGVKHEGGQSAYWNDGNDTVLCWSTKGLSAPACSLMYGPHYRQDKRYKRWVYPDQCYNEPGCVTYTPRFRMALDNHGGAGPNEDVCIIKVVFRYRVPGVNEFHDVPFIARTLKVGDFDITGKFDYFYLDPIQSLGKYEYPPEFILPKDLPQIPGTSSSVNYIDSESYTGIQFWVDWLRTDTRCTLYIDYAEVYDNDGWNNFIDQPIQTANKIINYADSFKTMGWDNIIYWSGVDEPYSIDCYTPIRVVDELIRSVQAPPLVVHFDPSWWYDIDINGAININGEDEIAVFDSIANPTKIILGMYPCAPSPTVIRPYDFEWLRFNFQRTIVHDSGFWFKPQTFGYRTNYPNDPPE